tara:strand:+ start:34 stop:1086 length:1053 start_codon:yes stop_codon:yes gene_type:complete
MEAIEQTWNGSSTTAGRCTATISRNGDLVSRMYLELTGQVKDDQNNPGASCITDVELEIGGQKIDKQSGLWMEVWSELTEPNETGEVGCLTGAAEITGGTRFQKMSGFGGLGNDSGDDFTGFTFHVPLMFWFCRNPGLALPLIALQYHEVKVILNHTIGTAITSAGNKLYCDYIYLDTDERRRFAQVSHEYLIEQVQEQTLSTPTGSSDLNFNHPVKELIWVDTAGWNADGGIDAAVGTGTYQLKLNGHDRFSARSFTYFTRAQVWQHHTGCPVISDIAARAQGGYADTIAVYSFALKPEEHQPSGTCNFSRIDNAQLVGASGAAADTIFAVNYNVLRIMSGMGGLAYSN